MESVQDLMQAILGNQYTVVFSNLGRYPEILFKAFEAMPHLQVAVQSPRIELEVSPHVRVVKSSDDETTTTPPLRDACNLLVVLEPSPNDVVVKPAHVLRVAVFTSQLCFQWCPDEIPWKHVVYFHAPDTLQVLADDTKRLMAVQDASLQTRDLELVFEQIPVDSFHIVRVEGRKHDALRNDDTYVMVDLRRHTSPFSMLIAFLDAFDFMLANVGNVKRWCLCFPEKNGRRSFDQSVQNCLDRLFCLEIDGGNVTSLAKVLTLVPFYRSGCFNRNFDIPTFSFQNLECVAVKTPQEACRAAAKYDMEHWAGPIYHVKEKL